MKKSLMTLAALALTAGAWAESYENTFPATPEGNGEYTEDLTQKNFKFYDNTELTTDNVVSTVFPEITPNTQWNMGENYMSNLDSKYDDGVVCYFAGGLIAAGTPPTRSANITNFEKGISIYDMGGKIGKVLVLNGNKSKLADKLKSELGLDETPNLGTAGQNFGAVLGFNWIQNKALKDQTATNEQNGSVKIRFEVNIYRADDKDVITGISRYNNGNNSINGDPAIINSSKFRKYTNDSATGSEDLGTVVEGSWNPYRWMVYDLEFQREGGESLANCLSALKMQVPANALDEGAILIRSIEMYFCPNNIDGVTSTGKTAITWRDYTPEGEQTPPTIEVIEGTPAFEGNVFTLSFDEEISQNNECEEQVTVTPIVDGKNFTVNYEEKAIKVTLADYPVGKYTISVPKSFVNVGSNGVNKEISKIVRIKGEPVKFGDITPSDYHFNNAEKINWYDQMLTLPNINKESTNVYGDMGFDDYFDNGLWVNASAGQNEKQQTAFRNGWSLVDFGGKVGQVAMFSGKAAGLKEKLIEEAPALKDNWEKIAIDEEATNGFQLRLYMDPDNGPKPSEGYVHGKIVYNVYAKDASASNNVFLNLGMSSNFPAKASDDDYAFGYIESSKAGLDFSETCCYGEVSGVNSWMPEKWQVLEFDFIIPEASDKGVYAPLALRINPTASSAWNNYAIMIQDITFTGIEGSYTGTTPNFKQSTVEIKPGFTLVEKATVVAPEYALVGNEITDADFAGFDSNDDYNLWSNKDASIAETYYYNNAKNGVLDADAAKIVDGVITISAPADLADESHFGIVKINTGIEVTATDSYDFSCSVGTQTRAAEDAAVKLVLTTDGEDAVAGTARTAANGALHYANNTSHFADGKLVLEVHFGGNAGKDISLSNLTFKLNVDGDYSGVENIATENAPVEYYNLQGVKVANPEKGIYIKKQGDKTTKVVL